MPEETAKFVVQPNTVYNRTLWPWLLALLAFVCLSIAIRFAWLGYWMIAPFAVLDVAAVGIIFYLISYPASYVEVIRVDHDNVRIQHIQKNNENEWRFPVCWTRIRLAPPKHRWYPHRLLIGSSGRWIEVGRCLTNHERRELALSIEREVARFNRIQKV